MSNVTILTLTYNRAHLLQRTIEHILAQSYTDFTYLIVNNGSTDDTRQLIEQYQRQDGRIQAIHMPKNIILHPDFPACAPLVSEMERRIFQPPDEYHMQIDDDDYMDADALETLVRLCQDYQADIATVGSQWVYPDGSRKDKFVFDGIFVYDRIQAMQELLKREKFNNAAGGKLYRKAVCDIGLPIAKWRSDVYREYRRINRIRRMVATGQPKYSFYRHDANLSGLNTAAEITPQKMQKYLTSNRERTQFLQKEMPELAGYVHYCELSFMISLYQRIYRLQVTSCYAIAEEMRKTLQACRPLLPQYPWFTDSERHFLSDMHLLETN
ncbi:MAG: glycosyltransferase family 2 protein [Butyricicoccus sp.]|nr:glycosyltransferase family 2 protein [Butyricicoccus sp.]